MLRTTCVIPATIVLLTATGLARGDDKATADLEQALRTLNAAFVTKDVAAIRRLMTDDHMAITMYYNGVANKEEEIRTLSDLQLKEYKAGKMKIQFASADVAIVTYSFTQQGTYKGKALAPKSQAAAVWVRRDGKWLEMLYQETPLEGR